MIIGILAQTANAATSMSWWDRVWAFVDTPAPYSPFSEYLLLLFVLWLIARWSQRRPPSFDTQAQEVLDQKYAEGEISLGAYRKFRQEMSMRLKR